LLVAFGWTALAHLGAYETYWTRLFAVVVGLLGWWSAKFAGFVLILAIMLPIIVSSPSGGLIAIAAVTLIISVFIDNPHALILVLATPLMLDYGFGPLALLVLVPLGRPRHSLASCLGVVSAFALALAAGQHWAVGYLAWGIPDVPPVTTSATEGAQTLQELLIRLASIQWGQVWFNLAGQAQLLAESILSRPLPIFQVLVWFVAAAVGLTFRGWFLLSAIPEALTSPGHSNVRSVAAFTGDVLGIIGVACALILGHLILAPLFTEQAVSAQYPSAILTNILEATMLAVTVLLAEYLVLRPMR
jgi:hypothetical protein